MQRLGLPLASGTIRVSLVHYNTVAEIHRFGDVLLDLTGGVGLNPDLHPDIQRSRRSDFSPTSG
jgi:hypothetical protein